MDWQFSIALALIALSGTYIVRSIWRAVAGTGKSGCGSGCGKCAKPADGERAGMIPLEQVDGSEPAHTHKSR